MEAFGGGCKPENMQFSPKFPSNASNSRGDHHSSMRDDNNPAAAAPNHAVAHELNN